MKEASIQTQSTPQKKAFTIDTANEGQVVHGRDDAVEAAKTHSARTGRPIVVERNDGRERMEFRRGKLRAYVYETRAKRKRS